MRNTELINPTVNRHLASGVYAALMMCLGMLAAPLVHAQTFEGNNSSSERVIIEVGSNGKAIVAWHPKPLGNVSIKEIWAGLPRGTGFQLVAPDNSLLKKPGDAITYVRISNNSTTLHCTSGCASTMPNLLGLQR